MIYAFLGFLSFVLGLLLWRDYGRPPRRGAPPKDLSRTPRPRPQAAPKPPPRTPPKPRPAPRPQPNRPEILVDGSNVMWWEDNTPKIETLIAVIELLQDKGFNPGVIFDATVGHKLFGGYRHHNVMAEVLGLPDDYVLVVPKGQVADRFLLHVAKARGLSVVSNDRYREWLEEFPDAKAPGKLVKGGWRDGKPWLKL